MKCFVIMPFGNPRVDPDRARKLDLIYSQWLKPTVESVKIPNKPNEKISCHRADKDPGPGDIISHIIENLVVSDIVIADLSGRNPNVFYELGVRHAVNNNTILIAENLDDIPFDLRGLRAIVYQYEPEQMINMKNALEQAITKILLDQERIDNPVRRFLYEREVEKLVKQAVPPGYDSVKSILDEMSSLRREFTDYTEEVRKIMSLLTSPDKSIPSVKSEQRIEFKQFEGIWKKSGGGIYCARVVNGELFVPYCYSGGYTGLTAHMYNFRLVGDALLARFAWFDIDIFGYIYFRIASRNNLSGGWWAAEDVPFDLMRDISRMNELTPHMNNIVLIRDTKAEEFPDWAEEYFKKKMYLRRNQGK